MRLKILDCTLRDGGYYNNWEFSKKLNQDYLNAISKTGIKYVELGFRSPKKGMDKGLNWYTSEKFVNSLSVPKNLILGVMVNVFEITSTGANLMKTVDELFELSENSRIKFIRLASHFSEIDIAFKICKLLKKKGYIVGINLMQITEHAKKNIVYVGKKASKCNPDILYFADSLGSMNFRKVSEVIKNLRIFWKGDIGIHAHDNLSKALSNTIHASKNGVKWIDSTVTGMGRGPGNVKTEELIRELNLLKEEKLNIYPILSIKKKYFDEMKKHFKWGTNPFYFLSGKYGIHPTYVQEMLSQKLKGEKIIEVLEHLKEKNSEGNKYDVNLIRSEFQKPIKLTKGQWSPKTKLKNKEIVLLASGKNLKKYKKLIENYIKIQKPVVISLKPKIIINSKLIDYYIACNPLRIISEVNLYNKIKKPFIIPNTLLTKKIKKKLKKVKTLDFGIGLKNQKFKFYNNCALIPKLYNVAYALALMESGKASNICLAGFDGYGQNDRRTKIVNSIFKKFISSKISSKISFLTPTTYSLKKIKKNNG